MHREPLTTPVGRESDGQTGRRGLLRGALGVAAATAGAGALWPAGGAAQAAAPAALQAAQQQPDPSRPTRCYAIVTGATQGVIEGSVWEAPGRDGQIAGLGFHHRAATPRDPATGMARGRPQYQPAVLTKLWDKASPKLFKALATGEVLPTVVIQFIGQNLATGQPLHDYTITLTNARVVEVEQYLHFNAAGHTEADLPVRLEDVAFSYEAIRVAWEPDGVVEEAAVTPAR